MTTSQQGAHGARDGDGEQRRAGFDAYQGTHQRCLMRGHARGARRAHAAHAAAHCRRGRTARPACRHVFTQNAHEPCGITLRHASHGGAQHAVRCSFRGDDDVGSVAAQGMDGCKGHGIPTRGVVCGDQTRWSASSEVGAMLGNFGDHRHVQRGFGGTRAARPKSEDPVHRGESWIDQKMFFYIGERDCKGISRVTRGSREKSQGDDLGR